ncbi:protein of unknown function [Parapedobacter luteus]|uniref:DUF3784 domain-containing protein n=1 Tax=Parapedobacter luteus TaxID=623280 RepID=A0A1T5FVB8_9SPHI|nr:DUF3784 domain-containing protein [Parapedobacter luteus]SKC00125.1 protein of unknown function [Parapedobacter luteus]
MIYVFIGMSVLFVAIGFIVTEKNAKYLLSGYNTMNKEDRKKVDIKSYIPYFRNFHVFLGISFLVLGTVLTYFVSENAGGIFLTVYPIIAYIYFYTNSKYSKGLGGKWNKTGVVILIGTLLFVVGLLGYGYKENRITFDSESVSFQGSYGETLTKAEIKSIELVSQLPEITSKTNGFALGTINKGYFKTRNGEIVKLILNSDNKPFILFTKADGKKIYYSAKDKSNEQVLDEMSKTLPNIVYRK